MEMGITKSLSVFRGWHNRERWSLKVPISMENQRSKIGASLICLAALIRRSWISGIN